MVRYSGVFWTTRKLQKGPKPLSWETAVILDKLVSSSWQPFSFMLLKKNTSLRCLSPFLDSFYLRHYSFFCIYKRQKVTTTTTNPTRNYV